MAAQGSVGFLEKVSQQMSRQNGKPILKPNKPLALRDVVANRKPKKGEATCVTEMSFLMACWKNNNYVDALCSDELSAFRSCVDEARAALKNKSSQTSSQGGRLLPKQANTLLKRYPNIRSEI